MPLLKNYIQEKNRAVTNRAAFLLIGILSSLLSFSQKSAVAREYKKAFPTYPYSDPNPIPSFTKIYPYYRYDGFTTKASTKEWKVIELENDYIKVMILPEIGGKIWTAIEKSTGKPFIYYNHSVKFRDVAMRGPWTSGGIEANYGIIGHTPNCATPVDYITKENPDGSVSCIIGTLDLLTRTYWRIDINLPTDKAYFTTKSTWYNPTSLHQPYYHWMNAGIKASGNLEFIYPGTHYLGHDGEYAEWPVNKENGKNISFYEQNNFGGPKSYHVFGRYTDFFGAYWHNDQYGMVRYSPHDEKAGKKIWIWGLSRQGMIWEDLLTDNDGQYVEVQSGRLFNQNTEQSSFTPFKHRNFFPHSTDTWTEYWYPVLNTEGMVNANEVGGLNIKQENNWLKILFCPVQPVEDSIIVNVNQKVVYSKNLRLKPLQTYKDSIRFPATDQPITVYVGGNKLTWTSDSSHDVLSRPVNAPQTFDWNSAYGLFVQGKELMDQRLFNQAEEKLSASLAKDSNFLPSLVSMAELMYRNSRYSESRLLARRALSIDTHDGASNYYYGLSCMQLQDIVNAKDGFDLATLSPEYRSAAYTELSKLYLRERQFGRSSKYAKAAMDFNVYNIEAAQLLAINHRCLNNKTAADEILNRLLSLDPLNAVARIENHIWKASADSKATGLFQNELPQESYLELASVYINLQLLKEAEFILQSAPESPLVYYWLAWLKHKNGEPFKEVIEKADQLSPRLVFPFRSEMIEVLTWVLKNSDSWKPVYYLALIYKDQNNIAESKKIFNQLGDRPDFAPFFAARAVLMPDDHTQFENDLLRAISMEKEQWRYYRLLGTHYLEQEKFDKALTLVEPFYLAHQDDYIMGALYARILVLSNRYKDADKILSKLTIIPFEGARDGHDLYREVKLMQAVDEIKRKNYKAALKHIDASKEWPEHLGVGKPYGEDVDTRLEDWMSYISYTQSGNKAKAESILRKISGDTAGLKKKLYHFPANSIVTAWAIQKTAGRAAATKWVDEQLKQNPNNAMLKWVKEFFETNQPVHIKSADSTPRILMALPPT